MTNEDKIVKQFEFPIVNKIVKMTIVEVCYLLDHLPCDDITLHQLMACYFIYTSVNKGSRKDS